MRAPSGRRRPIPALLAATVAAAALAAAPGGLAASPGPDARFAQAVAAVLALPYQPASVATSLDAAFGGDDYPAAFPLTDTAGGACCTGPVPDQPPLADLAPPFAEFPAGFELVELASVDGTPLHAYAALHPGAPGIVVMHGFNTNGKYSVVRYAAFLYANGYSVIAPDHRDMGREWARGGSYHPEGTRHGQTLGWKEAEDLLAAAAWLDANGTSEIGVLGFSEGAQNTILALAADHHGLIDTALTFSAPADQATLAARNPASTAALLTTVVANPDICGYLASVGAGPEFAATAGFMLRHDSAVDALDGVIGTGIAVPALHFYADDDTLVPSWNATMLASRTNGMARQHTVLLTAGNHAYFSDRWWTQMAALTWFRDWLDPEGTRTTTAPTVAPTPGGSPAASRQIDLSGITRADGDAERFHGELCPPVGPVGPTAHLAVSGAGSDRALDARRSYSGWDDHGIAAWTIDPGDGSAPTHGTDLRDALIDHRFLPGRHTLTLTVTDDTGRSDTAAATLEIGGRLDGARASGNGYLEAADGTRIRFRFHAADRDGRLKGRLTLDDKRAGVALRLDAIVAFGAVRAPCGPVAGEGAVEFTARPRNGAVTVRVCIADGGKPARGGTDLFYLECTAGCNYMTSDRTADAVVDGGDVRVVLPGS